MQNSTMSHAHTLAYFGVFQEMQKWHSHKVPMQGNESVGIEVKS